MVTDSLRGQIKATVVIPTHNRAPFLQDTLDSLLKHRQATVYEIVVVDNAPCTALRELVIKYNRGKDRPPIRYVTEPRTGLHHARHAGARAARGEIIIFIDDDVLVPAEWLSEMIRPYDEPTVAAVGGRTLAMFPEGKEMPQWWLSIVKAYLSLLDLGNESRLMTPPEIPYGCNMSIRRSVLVAVEGFHPDGFADESQLIYRGDGESGLAMKLYRTGYKMWYSASAWLYHQIPESRLSLKYLKHRTFKEGISHVFTRYRAKPHMSFMLITLLSLMPRYTISQVWHYLSSQPDQKLKRLLASVNYSSQITQTFRLLFNKRLREYVLQDNFLDGIPL